MYCPHCGNESTTELNYCVRCGGNLNPLATDQDAPLPAIQPGTAWAVGTTTLLLVVLGLTALLVFVDELSRGRLPVEAVVMIMLLGSAMLLGSVGLWVWLWSRLLGASRTAANARKLRRPTTNTGELDAADPDALPPARAFSVTEHTTRTLQHSRKK